MDWIDTWERIAEYTMILIDGANMLIEKCLLRKRMDMYTKVTYLFKKYASMTSRRDDVQIKRYSSTKTKIVSHESTEKPATTINREQ